IVGVVITQLMMDSALRRVSLLLPRLDPILLALCERDPPGFAAEIAGDLEVTVYDTRTLAPARPGAPPIDRVLLGRMDAGEAAPSRMYWGEPWGGAALRRTGVDGPCGLLMLRWNVGTSERRSTLAWLLGLAAL